jgi:excinuclease UvrABC nuclease subunit
MPASAEGFNWTGPRDFYQRSTFQAQLPPEAGFYAFTDCDQLRPGAVLYVGASLNLRRRVQLYDANTFGGQPRPATLHTGVVSIRAWQQDKKPLFVWWTLYPPLKKEKELVSAFVPRFNDLLTDEVAKTWGVTE